MLLLSPFLLPVKNKFYLYIIFFYISHPLANVSHLVNPLAQSPGQVKLDSDK